MVPVTIGAALGVIWSELLFVGATCFAGLVGVIAGWWRLVRGIAFGLKGLLSRPGLAWFGAALGAISALAGAGLVLSGQGEIFTLQLPALVPLVYLCVVRRQTVRYDA